MSSDHPHGKLTEHSETLARRLQAIELVEHMLSGDRARYAAILLHSDPRALLPELVYVAALCVARVAGDDDGSAEGLAWDKEILAELRARVRSDAEE